MIPNDVIRAIVADLAEADPTAAGEICGDPFCTLCGAVGADTVEHYDHCPWIRAKRALD